MPVPGASPGSAGPGSSRCPVAPGDSVPRSPPGGAAEVAQLQGLALDVRSGPPTPVGWRRHRSAGDLRQTSRKPERHRRRTGLRIQELDSGSPAAGRVDRSVVDDRRNHDSRASPHTTARRCARRRERVPDTISAAARSAVIPGAADRPWSCTGLDFLEGGEVAARDARGTARSATSAGPRRGFGQRVEVAVAPSPMHAFGDRSRITCRSAARSSAESRAERLDSREHAPQRRENVVRGPRFPSTTNHRPRLRGRGRVICGPHARRNWRDRSGPRTEWSRRMIFLAPSPPRSGTSMRDRAVGPQAARGESDHRSAIRRGGSSAAALVRERGVRIPIRRSRGGTSTSAGPILVHELRASALKSRASVRWVRPGSQPVRRP